MNRLTKQEIRVLALIAEGKTRKQIANLLFITTFTVDDHRVHIRQKLGLLTTADMIKFAIQHGLTSPEPVVRDYWGQFAGEEA